MNQLFRSSSIFPTSAKLHHNLSFHSLASLIFSNPTKKFSPNSSIPLLNDQIRPFATINSSKDASEPIDAGSSIRKPLSLWPGVYHSPVTNALWEARSQYFEKVNVEIGSERISQDGLMSKTPSQSRTSIEYKFSSDYVLREQYRNPWNEIRTGKLVEDLDALAGTISYKVIFPSSNFEF